MARQYQKTNWQNTPSTATPLSADNLNHIEDGIYNLETKVENNASAVSDLQSGKVDKVIGKGLSKNDFTDAYKTQIDDNTQDISINKSLIQSNTQSINNLYDIKVNKVTGKGLSTNDFTNNDVDKLRNDTYTKSETRGLVSKAYHPAGTIHVEDLVSSVLVNANLNNVYNLDGDGTTSNLFIEGAGHPLKDGTNIGVINFGTDESPNILFDDLGGFVDLSGYATTSAMNTALADKVDKISGKGLSTNDFTDIYKSQIETNQANVLTIFDRLETKVDKVTGKGLSTNDFTAEYINAINDNTDNISDNTIAIQTNATNITALQNNKVDKVVGKGLSTNDFTNNFKKGIAISQELAYDRATIPQPNLDADFHTVNGERSVIYQGNAYTFHTMTYNPISKKYVYGILCNPVYQGGLFFCEVDNPASDRHNWLDTTTFPTDILINGDIYTAVMPTGEAYYVSYSYNNNDEKELVYCNALDSSRLDYWIKTEIIINSIFNIGNYIFYVADNKVYKYEFAHGSVELDFDTVPFAYTYGGGRCIALTKNQYNVISAFMSYDGIEWTKVNFPSINKTNKPSGLIYDHGIFLFYQEDDEYVITSKDGFSWEKHKLSIDMTEFRENFMIFDEIGWGGGIFYACVNSVDEGHYDDYTIWTSQDGYTWEQTVKYLEDEIDNKTDYYNGTYLISVAQNLYYPTYRLDGVYGKGDVYTKSESNSLVIANPTNVAEGTLNKLKVNGTTYNLPQGGETNVQADWTETDPTSSAYIQHKPNLGTAASKDVPTSGNATSTQVVMGNDSRLTDARPASDVSAWAKANTKPTYTASEVGAYTTTEVDNKIADTVSQCYHPSGSKTVAELISSLLVSANEGNVYDMSDSGTTTSDFREGAGHPIKVGDNVGIVNIGTTQSPVYKFDLLSGFVDLSAYYTKTESDNKYVAKETGKGLSTNDYTTADKNKLAGIEAEANKTVVDSFMSDSSTNPLQNKVITKELEGSKTASGSLITLTDASNTSLIECIATISSSTSSVTITVKDTSTNPTVTNTYTIDLGQTVSSGTLDVVKGTLTTGGTIYNLPPTQIKLLKGNNVISSNVSSLSIKYQPDNALGTLKADIESEYDHLISKITPRTAKVYSFHISNSESDPSSKVTYLDDAVGMTPAKMNYSTGKFDYGSWKDIWFIKECKPCILAQAGYVMKYLDPDDYTKDIDGNTVTINGGLTGANIMIEFPKIWYKVIPDSNDAYSGTVSISPVKIDEGYKDYAYIDYQGNHKEHFYMPAYNGSLINNVMRSISGQAVSKTLDGQQEINYCKANGDGWYTEDAGEIILINFLLILMGKSTDTQTVYGQGLHTGGTEAINDGFRTGVHNTKGMFYGTNSGTIASGNYENAVKIFGMENYWGFQWRRYAGDILVDGVRKIKLCYGNEDGSSTFDYNLTGNGYVNVGATPSGTSGGYISEMKFTNTGMYSKVSSGSSSTHYCDGQWFNNSGTRYAFRGGGSHYDALVGAFCVALGDAASGTGWRTGAAPSYR